MTTKISYGSREGALNLYRIDERLRIWIIHPHLIGIDDEANLWIKGAIGLMREACKGPEMDKKFRLG
jgi:hypothetical protein